LEFGSLNDLSRSLRGAIVFEIGGKGAPTLYSMLKLILLKLLIAALSGWVILNLL
jgi:hypothetical protein